MRVMANAMQVVAEHTGFRRDTARCLCVNVTGMVVADG